jgi:hypothetical protein
MRLLVPATVFLTVLALSRPSMPVERAPRRPKAASPIETLPAAVNGLSMTAEPPRPRRIDDTDCKVVGRIAHLLELAFMAFRQENYVRCMDLCEWILLIDPGYRPAREIWLVAAKSRHGSFNVAPRIDELERETNDDSEDLRIPQRSVLKIPDSEAWTILSDVIPAGIPEPPVEKEPDLAEILRKLDQEKFDFHFEAWSLEETIAFIRDLTGLNILLDSEVRELVDPDRRLTFHVKDLDLRTCLRLLLVPFGLETVVTEERAVLLTVPYRAAGFAAKR